MTPSPDAVVALALATSQRTGGNDAPRVCTIASSSPYECPKTEKHNAITDARTAAGFPVGSVADDARLAMHQVFGMLIDRAALRRRSDRRLVDAVSAYTLRAVLQADPPPTPSRQ
jgi:hypothetical protein